MEDENVERRQVNDDYSPIGHKSRHDHNSPNEDVQSDKYYGEENPVREFGYDGYAEKRIKEKIRRVQEEKLQEAESYLHTSYEVVAPENVDKTLQDYDTMLVEPSKKMDRHSDMEISDISEPEHGKSRRSNVILQPRHESEDVNVNSGFMENSL